MTLRELIGLVVAFAVSNAFLSWFNPQAASNVVLFAIWNGMLAFLPGLCIPPGMGSIDRALASDGRCLATGAESAAMDGARRRGGDGHRRDCVLLLGAHARKARGLRVSIANDWAVLTTILLVSGASAFAVRALWRRDRRQVDVRGLAGPTPVEPLL